MAQRDPDDGYGIGGEHPGRSVRESDSSPGLDASYRSWRDRHMREIDRDYETYCREREQQFHRDFEAWREKRRPAGDERSAEIAVAAHRERNEARALAGQGNSPTPLEEATLGTNNPENSVTARAQPRR